LAAAVQAALDRDRVEADPKTLRVALALAQGSVRRALELVSGEGIALYGEIVGMVGALPELDGARLHATADRLGGAANSEQLELYFSLLLGLIERLIRHAATGEGAMPDEQALARQLISPGNLLHWAEAWEAITQARDEAVAYNLDRTLLLLETWFRLQKLAREHPV
jgi:DNA polymerase-3 subunit delta'